MDGLATETLTIPAAPDRVYSIIADYHAGHSAIVPRKYFTKLEVTAGGIGAGTRVRGEVKVFGRRTPFEHVVSEPEPGHTLLETDLSGSSITAFIVDPVDGGRATRTTIRTEFKTERNGLLGHIERWLAAATLRRIYRDELQLLAAHVQRDRQ
jgi:uncharacterized protein YndB with AHSA1/START domain